MKMWLPSTKLAVFLFSSILQTILCNEDLDGQTIFLVYHSLEPSEFDTNYVQRGQIVYHSSRNEGIYSDLNSFSETQFSKLKNLAASDDFYRVKLTSTLNGIESVVYSFTKACAIYESGLTDRLILTMDQSGAPISVAISAIPPYCTGESIFDIRLLSFNTTVHIVSLTNGPPPDTLTYIQRLEQEKAEKARGDTGDNRSFFSKYWMYIIPIALFLFISGASGPEGQGASR